MAKKESQASGTTQAIAVLGSTSVADVSSAVAYLQDEEKREATTISQRYNWLKRNLKAQELSQEVVDKMREETGGNLPANIIFDVNTGKYTIMGNTTLLLHNAKQKGKKVNNALVQRIFAQTDFALFKHFMTDKQVEKGKTSFSAKEAQGILFRAVTAKNAEIEEFDSLKAEEASAKAEAEA